MGAVIVAGYIEPACGWDSDIDGGCEIAEACGVRVCKQGVGGPSPSFDASVEPAWEQCFKNGTMGDCEGPKRG